MSLSRGSVRRPVAVSMFFVAVALLGVISFVRLPIDLLPNVAYPKLVVFTENANVAPAEIERFLTQPIERRVSTVPGVQEVTSVSREGVSLVTIRFAWGTDMDFAALNVREQLDNLADQLPTMASRPAVLRTDPRSEPIMALTVSGDADLYALKELSESVFKRRLEQIDGVAQAAVTGGLEREIHVVVDPRKLEGLGITIEQIANALDAANTSAPGGTIRRGRYRYSLRTLGEFQTVEAIGDVVLRQQPAPGGGSGGGAGGAGPAGEGGASDPSPASSMVLLRDVARIEDGFEERTSITRYDGKQAVGLLLFKESDANTVAVAEEVQVVLDQLRGEYSRVGLDIAMNQATFIQAAISNVVQALILGGILAFLVLFLFLRDPRYPLAIGLAIPLSVVAAFSLLDAAGVSLNIMSLGGLALGVGMLVDNSIVVLENIFRHREKGLDPVEAAAVGTEEITVAITSATLTTIAVFGPIVYVEGVAGELFGALSLAVAFSLLASILVAVMLLPTIAARWQARGGSGGVGDAAAAGDVATDGGQAATDGSQAATDGGQAATDGRGWVGRMAGRLFGPIGRLLRPPLTAFQNGFERFAGQYDQVLAWALAHRGRVIAIGLVLLAVAVGLGFTLNRSVLPAVDQGAFRVRVELPRGTPLPESAELATSIGDILLADPDVASVFTQIGRRERVGGVEDRVSGLNTALFDVRLERGVGTAAVIDRLRPRLAGWAGSLVIETGRSTTLGRILGGGKADLAVQLRGEDMDRMLAYAAEIDARLSGVESLGNVRVGTELGQPEIRIQIDRDRAAAFGIAPIAVAQTVEAYMRGLPATEFVAFNRKVPVVVQLPDSARRSLATLDLLEVEGVPLRELVRTDAALGPTEIRRREQSRVVPVYADVVEGGFGDAIERIGAAVAAAPPPEGIEISIGGVNEEMRESFRALGFAFVLAVLLVYMILAAEFESFIHPFTVLLSIPMGLVGAIVALWITGVGLNSMSLIGIIVLVGIVDNNAVVLLDFINQLRREGEEVRDAIIEACQARLRPILMTTATTLLGVLPLALGFGRGADLRAPLGIAILGGLFTATALTLIVIPVVYDLIEDARARLAGGADSQASLAAAPEPAGAGTMGDGSASRPPVPAGGASIMETEGESDD